MAQAPEFDELWDYNSPEETREKFANLLSEADLHSSYHLQLLTQLARTYSLEGQFDEAHKLLDQVEPHLGPDQALAQVRYLLERGRSFNSSGHQENPLN